MKKMIWLTVLFVLALVFVAPVFLSLSLSMTPANIQPGYDPGIRLSIYRDRVFTQKFVSGAQNLTAVGLSIRNPNLKNKAGIIFNLYDSSGNLIRTIAINGQNLEDGSFTKFIFDPIPDSLGRQYEFSLSSPAAGPEETIEVFIIESDKDSGITEYSYLGETHAGGTPMVAYEKPESKSETVKSVFSSWLSRLLHLDSQKSE